MCLVLKMGVVLTGGGENRLPPVEAVYRPHIVHHTIVPPEIKAQQMKTKTKQYFAAD